MLITPASHGYSSSRESEKVTVHVAIPDRTEILLGRNKGEWVLGKQPPRLLYDFSLYCVMTNPLIRWLDKSPLSGPGTEMCQVRPNFLSSTPRKWSTALEVGNTNALH